MSALLWLLVSFYIYFAIDLCSFQYGKRGWRRFVGTFFIFYSQILLTEFILGMTSLLTRSSLLTLNLIISTLVVLLLVRNKSFSRTVKSYLSNIKSTQKKWWVELKTDPMAMILVLIAILGLAWIVFLGLIFPVTDFDGNSYHLTFVGNAIQNHNIYDVKTSLPWLVGYPKGGELVALWSVMVANNDIVADLIQVPFVILGIASLYEISVSLGATKRNSRFSAVLFIFLPIVLNQLKTTYVDVILTATFFALIALVIKKKHDKSDLLLIGIISSFLISVKPTGILLVLVATPFLLKSLYLQNNRKLKGKISNYLKNLIIVLAPLTFGLYWYIKNLIIYGTPLYPFGLKIAGFSIFTGKTYQEFAAAATSNQTFLPSNNFQKIWYVWTERKDWFGCFYNYDSNFTGLGPVWFVVLVPAFLLALYFAVRMRNYLYLAVSGVIAVAFVLYPANYYTRYTMFISAIGIYSLALVMGYIKNKTRRLVALLSVGLALLALLTNVTLCNFGAKEIDSQWDLARAGKSREGSVYQNTIGDAYLFIQHNVNTGDTVVYDSSPYFIYALWNSDYSNRVKYVPAVDVSDWLAGVKSYKARYVFTIIGSKEYEWSRSSSELKSIYNDNFYEIFEVL